MTKQDLNEFILLLNTFDYISYSGIDERTEKWLLEVLPKSLPFFTHLVAYYEFPKVERITINKRIQKTNKRIRNIDFLKYPPKEFVTKYGRCNLKNTSIFYCAEMEWTALSEMRPKVGDLITKSIWKLKEEHVFKICPIFHNQPKNNTFNPRTFEIEKNFYKEVNQNYTDNFKEAVIHLSKFIAFHFSKTVNPENDKDYLFSAFFANKILNELENGTIEGILYPSVKENLSFENIALKSDVFDKYYFLSEVNESIIVKDPSDGGGGLLTTGTENCNEFDYSNNKILWNDKHMISKEQLKHYQKEFEIDLT